MRGHGSVRTALGGAKGRRVTRQARWVRHQFCEKKCGKWWIGRCSCHAPGSSTICGPLASTGTDS
jgi:hypothetical protein